MRDEADTKLLDQWIRDGHELGNHSFSHLDLTRTGLEDYCADIEEGRASLEEFLAPYGREPRYFRFPMLHEGETIEKLAAVRDCLARSHQQSVPVTIDNQDWAFEAPWVEAEGTSRTDQLAEIADDYLAAVRLEVRRQEELGDALLGRQTPQVLLLHANAVGAAQWDGLFTWLERTGHRFASPDDVLADSAFSKPHQFVASFGCGLWDRLAHARAEERAREDIAMVLRSQAEAWSHGDIEGFCAGYAEDALFVSPTGLTRGREAIRDRYRKRYPDRAAMGTLRLEIIETRLMWGREVSALDDALPGRIHGASVVARWTLTYADRDALGGLTQLALRNDGRQWVIVHDASM